MINISEIKSDIRNLIPEDRVKANHRCINVIDEPEKGCVRIDCVSDLGTEANPYAYYIQHATLTRFPHSLDEAWNTYGQQVYHRNFDEIIAALSS